MKTQLPVIVVFLFLPSHWRTPLVSAALCLPPPKKPASLAGFLFLVLTISRLTALSLLAAAPAFPPPAFTYPSLPSLDYSNSK